MSVKGFSRAGHTPSLVASVLHFDVSFMGWVLLGALGAYVAAELDVTAAQKGLMVAIPRSAGGPGGFLLPFALGSLEGSTGTFAAGFVVFAAAAVLASVAVRSRQRVWQRDWAIEVAV